MFSVTKTFEFEASHKLLLPYDSPCSSIHGHSYKVEVTVESTSLDPNGMVVDFTELKTIKDYVMTNWDHALIMSKHDPDVKIFEKLMREKNIVKLALVDDKNVTAENMAKLLALVLYEDIKVKIPESMLGNIKVSIWETRTNKATYTLK